jgi:thymidylate synthase (FAD)
MTISLRHVLDFFTYDLGYHPIGRDPDFAEIPGLLKKVIASWAPWAYQAYLKHPRHQNNQWVIDSIKNFTAKHRKELFDNICNSTHSVLDKGSISLIDFHGNDSAAIACLEAFPNPLKAFDLWTMTFAIEMPIPVYRQWVRHRHGTMVKLIVDYDRIVRERLFYIPERFRTQKGKVGSYIYEDMSDGENEIVRDKFRRHIEMACARYERLRSMGVVSDVAALNLPYTFYVPVIWHAPLGGIFNFLSLRTDSHAQWEMKEYAHPVWEEVKTHFDKSADLFVRNLYYGDSSKVRNS